MNGETKELLRFKNDYLLFFKNYDKISKEFKGNFVLFKDQEVVEAAPTMEQLKKKAEKRKIDLETHVVEFIQTEDIAFII